jgi:hypothetical protein
VGRIEQVDYALGVSATYACPQPTNDMFDSAWISPPSALIQVGYAPGFEAWERDVDAWENPVEPYEITEILDWDTGNPSVADIVDYPAYVGGIANGSTSLNAYGESNGWVDIENTEHAWISEFASIQVQHCPGNATTSTMRQEYWGGATWPEVTWKPACSDFSSSGGSTNFTWSQLNGGFTDGNPHGSAPNGWGIIKSGLWTALESTRTAFGTELHIESGYRCPHGNKNVGGKPQSRHMQGHAVDMKPIGVTWNEDTWEDLKDVALANGFTWNEAYEDDPSHLHVDQR